MLKKMHWVLGTAAGLLMAGVANAAPVTAGNLLVYRVGTGTGSLVNTGNPVVVDEFSPAGALVQSISFPTVASGGQAALFASGTATSEGLLSLSADGRYAILGGYSLTPGTSLAGTTGAANPRVIARIELATGNVDTSTQLTDFADGNNPRSATSTDGTTLFGAGGAGGIRSTTLGSTTSTQLSTTVVNLRQAHIFGGQLYVSTSSGSAVRIGTVGTGTPTGSGETITNLPGFVTAGSPYGFFFADLSPSVAGVDTLYVADDGIPALTKYTLNGGVWGADGTVGVDADNYTGVYGQVSADGTTVTLFATRKGGTTATGGGELVSLTDSSGYDGTLTGTPTLLASATTNTAFRGVVVTAVPEPGTLSLLAIGAAALLRRRR